MSQLALCAPSADSRNHDCAADYTSRVCATSSLPLWLSLSRERSPIGVSARKRCAFSSIRNTTRAFHHRSRSSSHQRIRKDTTTQDLNMRWASYIHISRAEGLFPFLLSGAPKATKSYIAPRAEALVLLSSSSNAVSQSITRSSWYI